MIKILYIIYVFLIVNITGCGSNASANPTLQSIDIRLKSTPVVKILSNENNHWLMTEIIDSEREEQNRAVKLISSKELSNINHAVSENEYLMDIALGPEKGQLWVALAPVKTPNTFVLRLINKREIIWETSITRPDKKHEFLFFESYPRGIEDFVRIVSDGEQVFIAGRNSYGFPFIATAENRAIIQHPHIIGPALIAYSKSRTSGIYSVMDQIVSRYKLHLAKCADSIIISWLAQVPELNRNLEYYGLSKELNILDLNYVSIIEVPKKLPANLDGVRPKIQQIGDALLQGISCEGNDLTLSGSSRIMDNAGSVPFIIQHGELSFLKDAFRKSASAQAVLTVGGKLILGGSTEWNQNPYGLSIDGGVGFIKIGDKVETFGETRTEVRSLSHIDGLLCYAGMIAGPTTHSHDHNPKSISGDGFLKCNKL